MYSYDINTLNGRTNSVTDARNNNTSYTYDAAGNVTSVSSGNSSNSYTYSANKLTAIGHNGMSYSFAYNSFGNIVSTRVGNTPLISHTYESNNGKLVNSSYGNGDEVHYTYDSLGRIIAVSNDSEVLASYTYNKKSQIPRIVDYGAGLTTDYEYSPSGSCIGKSKYSSDLSSSYYEYETTDENGNAVKTTVVDGVTKTVTDSTDETGNYVLNNDGVCLTSQSDDFGRKLTDSTLISEDKKLTTEYTYVDGANANETTELIESITHKCGDTVLAKYSYTYDANGNILSVSENDTERYVYTYDNLNQLTNVVDKQSAVRYFYTYDNAGNIKTASSQLWNISSNTPMGSPTTNSYTYGNSNWTDLLTKYKSDTITYDEIGNPISYRNGMTFSWKNGRQLATLTKDNKTTSYTYDISGIRTQKSIDGTVTKYYYDDSNNLVSMTVGDKTLMFYYDQNGSVSSVLYNDVMYYYIKNLQGDIMRIVDENGNSIAIYAYDQWGKPTQMRQPSTTTVDLVNYNPFLYRGYVYDSDSGLYYLQSRYYDPVTGRFLNADSEDVLLGKQNSVLQSNLFAYGYNNPIITKDVNGHLTGWVVSGIVFIATHWIGGHAGWFFYLRAKTLIFAAANAFLLLKGYTLSAVMFDHGMWGLGISAPFYIKNMLIDKLKNSAILNKAIDNYIKSAKKAKRWKFLYHGSSIEFSPSDKNCNAYDYDLYYALHFANYNILGQLYAGKWYIDIYLYDRYNFDNTIFFSDLSFGSMANTLGWCLEKIGMMIPYNVSVSYRVVK